MGVLKARVSGAWVPVSQGFSGVVVGFVGLAVPPGTQGAIAASTVDLTGMSVTFTADPTHRYKTTVYVVGRQGATGSEQYVYIADSSNSHLKASAYDVPANGIATHVVEIIETGLSGSTVRKARAQSSSANTWGTAGAPWFAYIVVEDITSMTPAGPDQSSWTSYVPVWGAATTPPNLGTTPTVQGAYTMIGKTCHWRAYFQANGTGIAVGSGAYYVTLPPTPTAGLVNQIACSGVLYGLSGFVPFVADIATAGRARLIRTDTLNALLDQTVGPNGGGHVLECGGSYEVA